MNFALLITRLKKSIAAIQSAKSTLAFIQHRVLIGAEHRNLLDGSLATVVDIGANRGQFSLAVSQWSPDARIFAFEPLPGPANIFRSLFHDSKLIILHEAAIGPRPTKHSMHVSARDDSSSLLPISDLQSQIFPGTAEASLIEVTVAPLDAFITSDDISTPAMLKLDVQGYEYEALMGCESLLHRFDKIYCECSFMELYTGQSLAADVIDWLANRVFRISGVFNPTYNSSGQAVQADFLFSRA